MERWGSLCLYINIAVPNVTTPSKSYKETVKRMKSPSVRFVEQGKRKESFQVSEFGLKEVVFTEPITVTVIAVIKEMVITEEKMGTVKVPERRERTKQKGQVQVKVKGEIDRD